jgi:acyl-coenzyme A thioesterase PaaI-like protein
MADYTHLSGHRFPGGSYTLPPWLSWLWSDAAKLEPDWNTAHPGLAYLVALRGAGVSIQDIFDLMGATVDSGVVFGEFQVDYHGVLRPGATYECEAEVTEVERKSGKRAGVFDKFTFQIRVREAGAEEETCVCTNSWIFPRAEGE